MRSVVNDFPEIFGIAFSKNSAAGTLLISSDYSLKISRAPCNTLVPVGKKSHTYLSKFSTKTSRFV